jgi:DNA invertase Pin-like site-specific DNA recombinase
MLPAAIYVRASTEHQKYSTSNQADGLRQYADAEGYTIIATYEDNGVSGLDLRGRPALRQLLHDVLAPARAFDVLLVYDVSRWGRFQDPDEGAYYEFLCRRAGVRVIYSAEPFFAGETGPMAAVLKSIKRAMAAEYSRELSRKTYLGQRRITLEGFAVGGVHNYGLRRLLVDGIGNPKKILERGERKSIQTDRIVLTPGPEDEVRVIRRIFRLCADKLMGSKLIARTLNQDHLPGPRGRRWSGRTIDRILTNEKYAGTNVYGRTRGQLKQRRVDTAPTSWIRKEGAFKGIISAALFGRANAVIGHLRPRRTDEQLIAALRALYLREGRITRRLMVADPHVAAPETYACRFSGIGNAYRLAGFQSARSHPPRASLDREALLQGLRDLLAEKGVLNKNLIRDTPGLPGVHVYRWHFGGLNQAYALIGYAPPLRGGDLVLRHREL